MIPKEAPPNTAAVSQRSVENSGTVFTSEMAKAANSAPTHPFEEGDEGEDAVEKYAKRTGRTLGFIALPFLAWLFGRQLGWW